MYSFIDTLILSSLINRHIKGNLSAFLYYRDSKLLIGPRNPTWPFANKVQRHFTLVCSSKCVTSLSQSTSIKKPFRMLKQTSAKSLQLGIIHIKDRIGRTDRDKTSQDLTVKPSRREKESHPLKPGLLLVTRAGKFCT